MSAQVSVPARTAAATPNARAGRRRRELLSGVVAAVSTRERTSSSGGPFPRDRTRSISSVNVLLAFDLYPYCLSVRSEFASPIPNLLDLSVAVGRSQEPRFVARGRKVHAALQHGVEEPGVRLV